MSDYIETNESLAEKCIYIAAHVPTIYMYAAYGFKVTNATINLKAKQNLNNWYTEENIAKLKAVANRKPPVWGFDCVNLIKGILWGWCEDESKNYGGAKHGANGIPDTTANGMIEKCSEVSTDFTNIEIGEAVWIPGHIGVYIGNGLVVECTPKWKDGVQITALLNIGKKTGYNGRTWKKHGKLPKVDYHADCFHSLMVGSEGGEVTKAQAKLVELSYGEYLGKWGVDGEFGKATKTAVIEFQKNSGLPETGVIDKTTWDKLMGDNTYSHEMIKIEGGNCYIRTAPSKEGKIIGFLLNGDTIEYQGLTSENGWHMVEYKGQNGWVSGRYGKLVK